MSLFTFSFKKYIITFLLIFIIGSSSFIIFSELIINNFVLKKSLYENLKVKFHKINKFDYVAFADSHGANGLKDTKDFINFSMHGDNLIAISEKILYFIENKNFKGIILQADAHQFASYRVFKNQTNLSNDFLEKDNFLFNFMRPPYRQFIVSYWGSFFKKFVIKTSEVREKNNIENKINNDIEKVLLQRVEMHKPISNFKKTIYAKKFKNLIKILNNKNVKVCLISFPLNKNYRKLIEKNKIFNEVNKFYSDLAIENNLKYFNFSSSLREKYFADPDHLNENGSEYFTKLVLKSCF